MGTRSVWMWSVVLGACSVASPVTSDDGEQVSASLLLDLEQPLPDDVSGIDLGDLRPTGDGSFCGAFRTTRTMWVNDAVFGVQYWLDAYDDVEGTVPDDAAAPLDRLRSFGEAKMAWNFGRLDDQPILGADLARDALAVVDAGVGNCGDLPLVITGPGDGTMVGWGDLTPEAAAARCESEIAELQANVAEYERRVGASPAHQQQVIVAAEVEYLRVYEETGEIDIDLIVVGSDAVGVSESGDVVPVPDGPCDR